jgi:hypothetical protein
MRRVFFLKNEIIWVKIIEVYRVFVKVQSKNVSAVEVCQIHITNPRSYVKMKSE